MPGQGVQRYGLAGFEPRLEINLKPAHNIYPDERSDDVYPTEGSEGVGAEHVYPEERSED
jgi:hypothetical protein